jgi:hypothetical protein
MIHGGRGTGLAYEAVPERLIGSQRGRENLQRHLPPEPLILGQEHDGHSPVADLLSQAVPGDPRTGRKSTREP